MNRQGPHAKEAERVYHKLRAAVVENVAKEYRRTGYVWEQYNDETGEGQGCRRDSGFDINRSPFVRKSNY